MQGPASVVMEESATVEIFVWQVHITSTRASASQKVLHKIFYATDIPFSQSASYIPLQGG